jgi:hypothetical protein
MLKQLVLLFAFVATSQALVGGKNNFNTLKKIKFLINLIILQDGPNKLPLLITLWILPDGQQANYLNIQMVLTIPS